jgi:hypothetical protein
VRLGPFLAATLIVCVFAVGASTSAAFAGYGPPTPPPPGGPPGFGRIIEAKTIAPSGGAITVSVPPCVVSVDVAAKTFAKSVELVLRTFDNQRVNWKKQDLRFLCGVGVTVYGQNGVLTHEPFSKRLTVSFRTSSIGRNTKVIDVAAFGHLTEIKTSISGHTVTVHVTADADLAVVTKS